MPFPALSLVKQTRAFTLEDYCTGIASPQPGTNRSSPEGRTWPSNMLSSCIMAETQRPGQVGVRADGLTKDRGWRSA